MHSTSRSSACRLLYAAAGLLVSASVVSASPEMGQDSRSAAAAKELSQLLDAAKLDAIAAPDPASPGSFIAAMYIPGAQLLVVSAKYIAPTLIADKLAKKDYRDVYMDLQAASVAGSRTFVQDMMADGLVAKPDGAGDVFEEGQEKSITYDGEWKKAKMSEDDYMKHFADSDDKYSKMLQVLVAQVKSAKAGSGN